MEDKKLDAINANLTTFFQDVVRFIRMCWEWFDEFFMQQTLVKIEKKED
jgi:hypothetical protein